MRLDRFLSNNLLISRKLAHQHIKAGRIKVDGQYASVASLHIGDSNQVSLDDVPVAERTQLYFMLHKPAGVVSATSDAEHPTVLDLLPAELAATPDLQIVGRLDIDTTGLLLLTTDGQWNHRLTSPKHHCGKTYRVTLAEPISAADIDKLQAGLLLKGETKPTLPCQIEMISPTQVIIHLHEGKYHQVKRMFAAVGNKVLNLHRTQVGHWQLPEDLPPGQYRMLAPEAASLND